MDTSRKATADRQGNASRSRPTQQPTRLTATDMEPILRSLKQAGNSSIGRLKIHAAALK